MMGESITDPVAGVLPSLRSFLCCTLVLGPDHTGARVR